MPTGGLMRVAFGTVCAFGVLLAGMACRDGRAQDDAGSFEGQTLRIIVGVSPGGSYDLHARLAAKYLGRHVPGNPAVVVENMPGAGGAVAAQYLMRRARPDGLTIGLLSQAVVLNEVTGDHPRGLRQLTMLGGIGPLEPVCVFSRQSGIVDVETWRRAPVPPRVGVTGPGSPSFTNALVLRAALGLPMRFVPGYDGSSEVRLAIDNGEVDGICLSWDAITTQWPSVDQLSPVLRATAQEDVPGLAHVAQARDLATSDGARALLEAGLYAANALGRFYAAPPEVSAQRAAALRVALARTLVDPDWQRDAARARLKVVPTSVESLERSVKQLTADPAVLSQLKTVLRGGE